MTQAPLRALGGVFGSAPFSVGERTHAELHSVGLHHGAQYVLQVHP